MRGRAGERGGGLRRARGSRRVRPAWARACCARGGGPGPAAAVRRGRRGAAREDAWRARCYAAREARLRPLPSPRPSPRGRGRLAHTSSQVASAPGSGTGRGRDGPRARCGDERAAAVGALQEVPVRVRADRADAGRLADGLRRRLPRADGGPAGEAPSTRWRRWRRARSPTPTRSGMVGHYWLRAPELAPEPELAQAIEDALAAVQPLRRGRARRRVKPQKAARFTQRPRDRHRRLGARPAVRRDALGNADGHDAAALLRQHRPGRHRPRARAARRQARRDAHAS